VAATAQPSLPAFISAITPQKKNKSRYSIFVDHTFLLGVSDATLLKYKLERGREITPALFKKLQRAEGRNAAKNYLLRLLARRDHARRELYTKAIKKDYSSDIVNDVLDELADKQFINDAAFAHKFARDKSKLNRWGPIKIQAHLRKKGISESVAKDATHAVFAPMDLGERLLQLSRKRRRHIMREENTFKRRKKVVDYLRNKGYRPGSIYNYLDELMQSLEDDQTGTRQTD